MRTEKQYGYLVGVGYVPINKYPGIAFYIQSPHCDAFSLAQAMDAFITECINIIDEITTEQWLHLQQGLANQLLEKDHNLRIKSQRFWASICNKDYSFKQKELLLQAVMKLTISDVKHFVSSSLVNACKPDRIILYSNNDLLNIAAQPKGGVIEEVNDFIKTCKIKY